MEFEVLFYHPEGQEQDKPAAEFIRSLREQQPEVARLVISGLRKLRQPQYHRPPTSRRIDDHQGIFELRVGGANIARVFFFFQPGRKVIVTNGYIGELDRARRYKRDWEARYG